MESISRYFQLVLLISDFTLYFVMVKLPFYLIVFLFPFLL